MHHTIDSTNPKRSHKLKSAVSSVERCKTKADTHSSCVCTKVDVLLRLPPHLSAGRDWRRFAKISRTFRLLIGSSRKGYLQGRTEALIAGGGKRSAADADPVRYTTYRPVGCGMDDMPDCLVMLNHTSALASLSRCSLCRPRPSASDYRQQLASETSCLGVMKLHSSSRHIVRILSYRPISTTYCYSPG